MEKKRTFIISRADSIGDVVLTLPVAGVLRALYPSSHIIFLGRSYTEEVVRACEHVNGFINWDECRELPFEEQVRRLADSGADTIIHVFPNAGIARAAKQAGIPNRIGTTNRVYHWRTCNIRVKLSRKNSPYHEAQLNLRLLEPLGARPLYPLPEIPRYYGLTRLIALPPALAALRDPERFNLILHPRSRGSAREWGLDHFIQLIGLLPSERFKIFITGTAAEGRQLESLFQQCPTVTDLTGKLTLLELMAFIATADGLVAASTGPLHLAAALGTYAVGIYPPMRPIHPGRWAPIGERSTVFVKDRNCNDCRKTMNCHCIREITPLEVKEFLEFVALPV